MVSKTKKKFEIGDEERSLRYILFLPGLQEYPDVL